MRLTLGSKMVGWHYRLDCSQVYARLTAAHIEATS
jgi:hypothetical protein